MMVESAAGTAVVDGRQEAPFSSTNFRASKYRLVEKYGSNVYFADTEHRTYIA